MRSGQATKSVSAIKTVAARSQFLGQLRYVPAAAEGAHEAHAGGELPALDVDGGDLVCKSVCSAVSTSR